MSSESNGLVDAAASTVAALVRRKELSPVELLRMTRSRLESRNERINAFITTTLDHALVAAQEAEEEIMRGMYRGGLHGIPVSIKDTFATRHTRTTAGSRILKDWVPGQDALAVKQLRDAGAVIIGKTNLDEFAWGSSTINPHFGATRNPWDLERIAGGSSGGSAAAVAAGMGFVSLGSETAESIRCPAAFCGIVGVKATHGRISRLGMIPSAPTLDQVGVLARNVRDAALVLKTVLRQDRESVLGDWLPAEEGYDWRNELRKLRVGVPAPYLEGCDMTTAVRDVFAAVLGKIEDLLGLRTKVVTLPRAALAADASNAIIGYEAAAFHQTWFADRPHDYGQILCDRLLSSMSRNPQDYRQAQETRGDIFRELESALREVDVIVAPTVGTTAPLVKGYRGISYAVGHSLHAFSRAISLAGLPVASVPCWLEGMKLPVGIQIAGRPNSEQTVLRVACALESLQMVDRPTAWA